MKVKIRVAKQKWLENQGFLIYYKSVNPYNYNYANVIEYCRALQTEIAWNTEHGFVMLIKYLLLL